VSDHVKTLLVINSNLLIWAENIWLKISRTDIDRLLQKLIKYGRYLLDGEFIDKLSDCKLLKTVCAPWR